MWIITPMGFFSIVQKPSDVPTGTLTVRARVRSDLEALQAAVLPGLGTITENKTTDYRFRATAPRSLVEAAMAKLTAQLDYSNFKTQVAKVQGSKRAHLKDNQMCTLRCTKGPTWRTIQATCLKRPKITFPVVSSWSTKSAQNCNISRRCDAYSARL